MGALRNVRILFLLLVLAGITQAPPGTRAETVPQPLRSDIQVRRLLTTPADSYSIRIAKDPRNNALYYIKDTGKIYRVNVASRTSTQVYSAKDHGRKIVQGFAIGPDGTMYVVGNDDLPGTKTQATIAKGVLKPGGLRSWSILAQTDGYPKSKTAFDHRMNGVVVDPKGAYIFINSGSRTDHGEVQSVGGLYPRMREVGLTACILRLSTSSTNLVLRNDRGWLKRNGYMFVEGTRNTFDMAFAPRGDLIGTENGPDRDMSDELNWLRPGAHYGFPWRIGGADNPQQFPDYDPANDKLLNPLFPAVKNGYWRNDPTFPSRPTTALTEPITNLGPDADKFRNPQTGLIQDASASGHSLNTFTAHRSPLGLVFDRTGALSPAFRGHGFMLSWTKGDPMGDSLAGPFKDPSQDLIDLQLLKTETSYTLRAHRMVGGFNNPIDAEIIGNKIYVLDYGGTQALWEVTLPSS